MKQYLLPCSCGRKVAVDRSQAGLQTECECGARLDVPTMRGLAELEPVDAPAPEATADKGAWGPPQGLMFLGGLLLCIGLAALAYVYPQRPHIVFDTVSLQRDIGSLNPETSWQLWQELRQGLNRAPTELSSGYQNALSTYYRHMTMAGGLAVVGAVLLATGLAMKFRPAQSRPVVRR
jgi:hypothetical protein